MFTRLQKQMLLKNLEKNFKILDNIFTYLPLTTFYLIILSMVVEEHYQLPVAIMIVVLNAISALSLAFIMVVYVSGWKTINSFPMRLVFYLCIACFIQNLYVFVMGPFKVEFRKGEITGTTDPYCTSMAVIKTGADLSSVIWTFLVTYSAYASVVKSKKVETLEIRFILIGFLLPFLAAVIPVPVDVYGYGQYYCWFLPTGVLPISMSMVFYYLPLWAFFIANTVMFTLTYRRLKELEMERYQLRVFKRMLFFPLILFVVALFSTIHRILLIANEDILAFAILDYLFTGLYGFLNALAYGFNPTIRDYIHRLLCKKCLKRRVATDRSSSTASDTKRMDREIFLAEIQT